MDVEKKEALLDKAAELQEKNLDKVSGGMICPGTIPDPKDDDKKKKGGATGSWGREGGATGSW